MFDLICPIVVLILIMREITVYETRLRGRIFWFTIYQSFFSLTKEIMELYLKTG